LISGAGFACAVSSAEPRLVSVDVVVLEVAGVVVFVELDDDDEEADEDEDEDEDEEDGLSSLKVRWQLARL
jgi:hypothetical protein